MTDPEGDIPLTDPEGDIPLTDPEGETKTRSRVRHVICGKRTRRGRPGGRNRLVFEFSHNFFSSWMFLAAVISLMYIQSGEREPNFSRMFLVGSGVLSIYISLQCNTIRIQCHHSFNPVQRLVLPPKIALLPRLASTFLHHLFG